MASVIQPNTLLARLSPENMDVLRPHLSPVDLPLRFVLEKPAKTIDHVYFPDSGIASVVAIQLDDTRVEVGLIGREGMSGVAIVLGNHQTPNTTYMQVAGTGQRITAEALRSALETRDSLRSALLKFVQAFLIQVSHTAICNAHGHIDERLSRWILMAHDRVGTATLPLTHEFLALMLGVRRAGVTQALNILVARGLIKSQRGAITVIDRIGLEESAGDSYGVPESEYRRLLGK